MTDNLTPINTLQDDSCSICLAALDPNKEQIIHLKCGHRFHKSCLVDWINTSHRQGRQKICPNCRQPLTNHEEFWEAQDMDFGFMNQDNAFELFRDDEVVLQNHQYTCQEKCGLTFLFISSFIIEALILSFFIHSCQQFVKTSPKIPIFSAGIEAKGIIAIGMFAEGIIAIGMMAQGLFTISMVGIGVIAFIGQVGGGLGFGIYQMGISWYCYMGQLSIGIWATKYAQIGVSLLAPLFTPQHQHCRTC